MKRWLIILWVCSGAYSSVAAQQKGAMPFMVGAAEATINPPTGSFMAGYQPNRKSTGIHDDLFAKAVVISSKDNAFALVAIDCIGLPYPLVQRIRDMVEQTIPRSDFNADQIVVSSTHTHAGPDVIGIWGEDMMHSGTDSAYAVQLVQAAATAVIKAWKSRQPAIPKYAVTTFGEGWVENISDSLEIDRSVTILQFVTAKGKSIASLTNFACHPTISTKDNTLISADYPSGVYKQLKAKLGGVNLFLQGAIGGWVQPEHVPRTLEIAEQKGRELATAVTDALKQAIPLKGDRIRFASRQFELQIENKNLKDLAAANVIKRDIGDGTPTEIAWFSVGEAMFATHPGETSPLYSHQTKKLMTTHGPKFLLGLGLDELGYILKPDFFAPGTTLHAASYLTSMSPGKEAGAAVMQVLEELSEDNQ